MQDTKSASLVLIAGAAGMAWWWYHITQGRLAPAAAGGTDPTGGPALGHQSSLDKFGKAVPLTGPEWQPGHVFKSDQEFSDAVNRAIRRARG